MSHDRPALNSEGFRGEWTLEPSIESWRTDMVGLGYFTVATVPDTIAANTPYGELVRLAPPVKFSETNGYREDPVVAVRGSCKPEWSL